MELRMCIMIVNSKNQPKKQLSVNLGEELSIKLDTYCQVANTNRSDVIRTFIATLPEQGVLSDTATKSLLPVLSKKRRHKSYVKTYFHI